MKKAVIFDLFGTLVETFEKKVYMNQVDSMASVLGIEVDVFRKKWNEETSRDRMLGKFASIGENIEYILGELGAGIDKVVEAEGIRIDFAKKCLSLYREGVIEVLEELKGKGYKLGLISDCSPDIPILWKDLGLNKYFDSVIFSCEVKVKKPSKNIYYMSMEALGVEASECCYVGDGGSNELSGAEEVGMHPILIKSKEDEEKGVYKKGVDSWNKNRIFCLRELMELID